MMDAMGIILTENRDMSLGELTDKRAVSAMPLAGRYRLIDFILSNMVNSDIINVGVTTQNKCSSLMDHLGSGKEWDLNRKYNGLFILPTYFSRDCGLPQAGSVDVLHGIISYIKNSRQKYVVLSEGNIICNMTFDDVLEQHINNGADITVVYNRLDDSPKEDLIRLNILSLDKTGRLVDLEQRPANPTTNNADMGIYILEKTLLERLVENCVAHGLHDWVMDVLVKNVNSLKMYGYEFKGYVGRADSVKAYYDINMQILKPEVRAELFGGENRIYTKIKDQSPTRYGSAAKVGGSLIADGCIIEGEVENSVIFRGVHISKGAKVKNSIVMQNSIVSEGCSLENVVLDKSVFLMKQKMMVGPPNHPVIIPKNAVV